MGSYTLSGKADADIEAVAEASLRQWGLRRTEKYIPDLHETFQMLVEFPDLGRDAGDIRPGYRKIETGGHSVFRRKTEEGVLIVRILHQSMDFERHLSFVLELVAASWFCAQATHRTRRPLFGRRPDPP